MRVTRKQYIEAVGRKPVQDDLERSNCQRGGVGHYCCGWCQAHDKPRFECGCRNPKTTE